MNRWKRPLRSVAILLGATLAWALLNGFVDPANETDAKVRQERHEKARARIESMPPAVRRFEDKASLQRMTHPMAQAQWADHHYIDRKGKPKRERRYTPHGDLAR